MVFAISFQTALSTSSSPIASTPFCTLASGWSRCPRPPPRSTRPASAWWSKHLGAPKPITANRRDATAPSSATRRPIHAGAWWSLVWTLMDPVSCVSCVSWMHWLYAFGTHETLHQESGMRYQVSSPGPNLSPDRADSAGSTATTPTPGAPGLSDLADAVDEIA